VLGSVGRFGRGWLWPWGARQGPKGARVRAWFLAPTQPLFSAPHPPCAPPSTGRASTLRARVPQTLRGGALGGRVPGGSCQSGLCVGVGGMEGCSIRARSPRSCGAGSP
jgi:hypothetical protein